MRCARLRLLSSRETREGRDVESSRPSAVVSQYRAALGGTAGPSGPEKAEKASGTAMRPRFTVWAIFGPEPCFMPGRGYW